MVDPISALATLGTEVVKAADDWFTSDEERAEANRVVMLAQINAAIANAELQIRAYEAESKSGHKGWRHQVGVTLSLAFGMHFVVFPLVSFVGPLLGQSIVTPEFDIETLMPIMLGMLGLGGIRAYDLKQGTRK